MHAARERVLAGIAEVGLVVETDQIVGRVQRLDRPAAHGRGGLVAGRRIGQLFGPAFSCRAIGLQGRAHGRILPVKHGRPPMLGRPSASLIPRTGHVVSPFYQCGREGPTWGDEKCAALFIEQATPTHMGGGHARGYVLSPPVGLDEMGLRRHRRPHQEARPLVPLPFNENPATWSPASGVARSNLVAGRRSGGSRRPASARGPWQ